MIGCLDEAGADKAALDGALQHRLHQGATDTLVLQCRIDGDRPQPADWIALVQKVTAHDPAVEFGYDVKESRVTDQHGEKADRAIRVREIRWEVVLVRDSFERSVANLANGVGIGRIAPT